jgi:hypothetical protein
VATTQIADTIYHADGTPATGTIVVSWPAFTTASGESIPTGTTSATIATGGALSIQLIPNAGSTPIGSYYTVVYHLDDDSVSRQYWVVPVSSAPVKVSAIESSVLPTSVAMQTVSKSYVDTAIAAALTGHPLDSTPYVLKAGDTMTGPLILPADPVSATQAADKNYVDESVAALSGGIGQKVSTLPSATQVVAQPTGTQLDVNQLNGVEYASQYVSGRGNDGIANVTASSECTNGCEVKVEQDYTDETYSTASLSSQTHIKDARGGRQVDSYINPLDVVNHGLSTAQAIDDVSTQSEASIAQQTSNSVPGAWGLSITQEGLAGGSNLFPEQIENPVPYFKMGYSALSVKGTYNTQGQHGLVPEEIDCYGVGDCLIGSQFIVASGGVRDSADEGAHPFDLQIHEDAKVFAGTCASGCTAGSNTLMIAATSAPGTQGDGRFLIDTNPTKSITSAGTGGALIGGTAGQPHAAAQFSGTSFPVSVFLSAGQVIPSQTANMAPGTVTFPIATTGIPSGYAASTAAIGAPSGLACVVDRTAGYAPDNYEVAPYTVVDATHLQMTLNKPHQILATIAIGGLCGYGLEQTVDTANGIRQLFPVVGTISATSLYYAGANTPVVGIMNQTSGYLNLSAAIASATRAGNLVTVTTAANLAADVNGLTVTIAGVADSSYNGSFAVATTGANSFTYAQTGANSSSSGGTASVLTGGFAFYPMAEVLSVFDPAARSVDGQMTLAPNNVAWAANDPVEEPHFYQEVVSPDTEYVGQSEPRPTVTVRAGLQYQQNNGPGLIGWSIANAAPAANYLGYGGTHRLPDGAYEATGIWQRTMNLAAGEQAAFAIHCNLHGCGNWNSGYNLFELDSSTGTDTVAYSPTASSLSLNLRGTPYSFTPQALTAGTIDAGTLNATTLNGSLSGASISSGTIAAARLPLFGPSGAAHAPGIVPDPGATAGSTRFLREDGTWTAPSGGISLGGDIGGTSATPLVTGLQGHAVSSTAPAAGQSPLWNGAAYAPVSVPTLDSNGRVIPGGSVYGGVLGNDASGHGLGPAIFSNGNQVALFNDGGGTDPVVIVGNWQNAGSESGSVKFAGQNSNGICTWGYIFTGSGDGAINKYSGGCNNIYAALAIDNNQNAIVDFEPDAHMKLHESVGGATVAPTFATTPSSTNCGTGATFDKGSNDGAGRIVVGSSPPSVCRVNWSSQYANAIPVWENAAPHCSVENEGQRATGTITIGTNPNSGDTVTVQGTVITFGSTVPIGASASVSAANLLTYLQSYPAGSVIPATAPGTNPALAEFDYALSGSTIALTYTYMDGVTGNSATLATSSGGRVTVSGSTLSGGALPSSRYVVAQSGTGGMAISAPGGTLNAGDVLAYTCVAYW